MAMGVRDITNLEELLEVQDDDKIIVIRNGEAKLVSKANAKFGGGTVTIFYAADEDGSTLGPIKLVDVNDNPISAQVAYDAAMSGLVYIDASATNSDLQGILYTSYEFYVEKSGEEMISVVFTCTINSSKTQYFYAGAKPTGGAS